MKLVKEKLRVVHIPQIPGKAFTVEVKNEREAYLIEQTLANQHNWLLENNIIPDFSNAISVELWDDDLDEDESGEKWTDYWNSKEAMEWVEFTETYEDYVNGRQTEEDKKSTILTIGKAYLVTQGDIEAYCTFKSKEVTGDYLFDHSELEIRVTKENFKQEITLEDGAN